MPPSKNLEILISILFALRGVLVDVDGRLDDLAAGPRDAARVAAIGRQHERPGQPAGQGRLCDVDVLLGVVEDVERRCSATARRPLQRHPPQLAEVLALLAAYRFVSLTGPGGIGKTRLALAAARQLLPEFADGVWVVELSAVADSGLQGKNDSGKLGYTGPCPPSGRHRYFARLYALRQQLDLPPGATASLDPAGNIVIALA